MSKKKIIILILVTFFSTLAVLFYLYFSNDEKKTITVEPNTEFPFGTTVEENYDNIKTETNNNTLFSTSTGDNTVGENFLKIKQVYKKPVSGMNFVLKNKENILIFIDRASGNLFQYETKSPFSDATRLTNTTIPKTQEGNIFNNGKSVILRTIDELGNITSLLGKISTTTENTSEISGFFLTKNIEQLLINREGDTLFELLKKEDKSGSVGYIYKLSSTTTKKQIFESPIYIWNISWPKEEIITFTTKPTYRDYGFLFFFNTKTFSFDRILGDINGLTTKTNSSTEIVVYSENTVNNIKLGLYNIKNNEYKDINIKTISDKCIWSEINTKILYCAVPNNIPKGNYPDDWYQGKVSFNDSFWMINTEEGTTKKIFDNRDENNLNIDTTELKISSDEKYLTFINKNDLSLWLLDLSEEKSNIEQ